MRRSYIRPLPVVELEDIRQVLHMKDSQFLIIAERPGMALGWTWAVFRDVIIARVRVREMLRRDLSMYYYVSGFESPEEWGERIDKRFPSGDWSLYMIEVERFIAKRFERG